MSFLFEDKYNFFIKLPFFGAELFIYVNEPLVMPALG